MTLYELKQRLVDLAKRPEYTDRTEKALYGAIDIIDAALAATGTHTSEHIRELTESLLRLRESA